MEGWEKWLVLAAAPPILRGVWVSRKTTLTHVMIWAIIAWIAWVTASVVNTVPVRYLALVFTGCAGVAVLGARRPGASAWHAVVAGLLAVLLMPLAQGFLSSTELPIGSIRTMFLGALLAVGLLNYVPTRLGLGAIALLMACVVHLRYANSEIPTVPRATAMVLAGLAPWLAWLGRIFWRGTDDRVDRTWREFRDGFGVVWGQRVREQFNRAAHHAGLNVELSWRQLVRTDGGIVTLKDRAASAELLAALMTRFGIS